MLKRFLAVAAFAAMLIPSSAFAVDHSKQWALGYFFDDAPIGIRYMVTPKVGIDAGFGFQSEDGVDYSSPTGESSANTQFSFELGVPFNVVKTDRADFFIRPSFAMTSVPYYYRPDNATPYSSESVTDTNFGVMLGAEWHATDNLSLSFGHGLGVSSGHPVSAGDPWTGTKPESSTSIATTGLTTGASSIGFRWYF
jgi:opacity protein-like surface antigen